MANFGWAYVDCSTSGGGGATGPTGSLQFISGALGQTTGSHNLIFYTASLEGSDHTAHLVLSGNLKVTGSISASVIHYEDVTRIDATGSTYFGNTTDDVHERTGSLSMMSLRNPVNGAAGIYTVLSASAWSHQTFVKGFGANYTNVTSSHHTASTPEHILGVTATRTPPPTFTLRSQAPPPSPPALF